MAFFRGESDRHGIAAHVSRLAEALGSLLVQHMKLARLELAEDARAALRPLARMALAAPLFLTGYALLCVAGALFLSRQLPLDLSLGLVAALNFVAGGAVLLLARRASARPPPLDESLVELRASASALTSQVVPSHVSEPPDAR